MAERTLEDRLRALGASLVFDHEDALADDVLRALDASPRRTGRRAALVVAAAALVVVVALVAVPGSRRTIARWLGFDELRIEQVDVGPPTVTVVASLLTLEEAAARVGVTPLVAPTLGPPVEITAPLDRYVLVRYADALVATLPGRIDDGMFEKLGTAGVAISRVDLDGVVAYWLSGEPHVFLYTDADGVVREARPADDTLVWQRGDVIARIEGADLTLARAIELARALRPA